VFAILKCLFYYAEVRIHGNFKTKILVRLSLIVLKSGEAFASPCLCVPPPMTHIFTLKFVLSVSKHQFSLRSCSSIYWSGKIPFFECQRETTIERNSFSTSYSKRRSFFRLVIVKEDHFFENQSLKVKKTLLLN